MADLVEVGRLRVRRSAAAQRDGGLDGVESQVDADAVAVVVGEVVGHQRLADADGEPGGEAHLLWPAAGRQPQVAEVFVERGVPRRQGAVVVPDPQPAVRHAGVLPHPGVEPGPEPLLRHEEREPEGLVLVEAVARNGGAGSRAGMKRPSAICRSRSSSRSSSTLSLSSGIARAGRSSSGRYRSKWRRTSCCESCRR